MLFGKNKSLVCFSTNPRAEFRLFCFPCAGAGASMYRRFASLLPEVEVWAVNYPGRESLYGQPFAQSLDAILGPVVEQRALFEDRPFFLYGHSFGALVAFACAVRLQDVGCHSRGVLVSARRAPHLPAARIICDLPDDRFVAELDRFGGMPSAIRNDPEMMGIYMPVIRADLHLNDVCMLSEADRIDAPLTVFSGSLDRVATSEELHAWKNGTRVHFEHREIKGGHFFIQDNSEEFIASLKGVMCMRMNQLDENVFSY